MTPFFEAFIKKHGYAQRDFFLKQLQTFQEAEKRLEAHFVAMELGGVPEASEDWRQSLALLEDIRKKIIGSETALSRLEELKPGKP